jgi:hypothetical protein
MLSYEIRNEQGVLVARFRPKVVVPCVCKGGLVRWIFGVDAYNSDCCSGKEISFILADAPNYLRF